MTATSKIGILLEALCQVERTLTGPSGETVSNAYSHPPADPGSERCPFFINEIAGAAPITRVALGTYKVADRIRATLAVVRKESGPSLYDAEESAMAWRDTLLDQLPKFLHLATPDFVSEADMLTWNIKPVVIGTTEYMCVVFEIGVLESWMFTRGG